MVILALVTSTEELVGMYRTPLIFTRALSVALSVQFSARIELNLDGSIVPQLNHVVVFLVGNRESLSNVLDAPGGYGFT